MLYALITPGLFASRRGEPELREVLELCVRTSTCREASHIPVRRDAKKRYDFFSDLVMAFQAASCRSRKHR